MYIINIDILFDFLKNLQYIIIALEMCNNKKAGGSHHKEELKKEAIPALTGT